MNTIAKILTQQKAVAAIKAYNCGLDRNQIKNITIDADARKVFADGLGSTLSIIEEQLHYIGDDYGGVAGMPKALELTDRIAQAIFVDRKHYLSVVKNCAPFFAEVPKRDTILTLYAPFQQELKLKNGSKKNWLVWGAKFWHFLNIDSFPILDRFVADFTGVSSLQNSVDKYMEMMHRLKTYISIRGDWLPAMRVADNGQAWSDLKLWDKVIYQIGYEERSKHS